MGYPIGPAGATLDPFGDSIMCATLPFDTWRICHDTVKLSIVERAYDSKVEIEPEVYGLFSDLVPAAAIENGAELQSVHQRQGRVPDFHICLPTPKWPLGRSLSRVKGYQCWSDQVLHHG